MLNDGVTSIMAGDPWRLLATVNIAPSLYNLQLAYYAYQQGWYYTCMNNSTTASNYATQASQQVGFAMSYYLTAEDRFDAVAEICSVY